MRQIKEIALSVKNNGVRASFARYGWRLVLTVVAYYVVRDLTIYVLIPYLFIRR